MKYQILKRNKYFEVFGGMLKDDCSDHKVGMIIDIDLTRIEDLRKRAQAHDGTKPSYTAFLVKAIAETLKEHKHVNQISLELPFYKRLVQLTAADISVAVEKDMPGTEQVAYVATIRNADHRVLTVLSAKMFPVSQIFKISRFSS